MPSVKPLLSSHLHDHTYPEQLMKNPELIRLVYAWKYATLQRNWKVWNTLTTLLPKLPAGSRILDAGCGEGLFLFPFSQRFPQLYFTGMDRQSSHIEFCHRYKLFLKRRNLAIEKKDLENLDIQDRFEVILCIGTLQYTENDEKVLQGFCRSLEKGGKLILYVPVNGRMVLPGFRTFIEKTDNYENRQNRMRVYTASGIKKKLAASGFSLCGTGYTYGPVGIAAHELYIVLLVVFAHSGLLFPLTGLVILVLLPLIILAKAVDYLLPTKNGNGMLLVATKG